MRLWIMRHGEAQAHAPSDALRPLSARGKAQALESAAQLRGVPLAGILASPYTRAQQTALLVQQALGGALPLHTVPWLTPDTDPGATLCGLEGQALGEWLLVSHQPLVGCLLGLLERGEPVALHPMNTASLAELDGEGALAGLMTLRNLFHPQQ
ncbi:phosphohistidine phosphatase SixA [Pseudomonas typographi]|uniref:Phosphohistidine phosphatase SixA n=1 Tax=Pseudomonas typographi TaxID=2715964 RepID=A0ABR7Z3N9_9PSED|nr:phosphohistidine phosphatase SixA [Pseudomonas typographi]MBD1552007.1 phosphohistidine phosphatase SixA [Pseudomonas typographi]MBD1586570.1 phosphohistidine phosphatase SixA [Pseudomonas typographi]MBD1600072.1 phosphohistidine phosphatase SixA [Pseudomonas typographi]